MICISMYIFFNRQLMGEKSKYEIISDKDSRGNIIN